LTTPKNNSIIIIVVFGFLITRQMEITMTRLYQTISKTVDWMTRLNDKNEDLITKKMELIKSMLPCGSGIDSGCEVDWDKSKPEKLIINSAYHLMDEGGGYYTWCYFKVIVTPTLQSDFDMIVRPISARDKRLMNKHTLNGYLWDVFNYALLEEIR
jgi:hypothetical protein